ncbi:YciI family protein [Antribacter sp. KLBMP9083]|uniref:YciI family protein n=1 Tax=Antribacter soli TaxID=2910976 RepID=A0AA41QHI1_9MICO|nr:YciI family protein [Antribacter soli]MCF4123176.1 YciI family protein [Antribacter soli]
MSTEYMVLLPSVEQSWLDATPEQKAAVYDRHREFMGMLAQRGHTMTGGSELAHSSGSKVVHADGSVTDGPYAETVEQLSGFYLIRTDDLDDLLQVVAVLADAEGPVEVRECLDQPASDTDADAAPAEAEVIA